MVHLKLHFYVDTFHVWSGLGGWISFLPKNAACSQNSFDSGRLLHLCSVVFILCAWTRQYRSMIPFTDESPVFNDGRKCVYLRFRRLIAMEADQYCYGSAYIHLNSRILLCHSGLPNWPMLQEWDCMPPHPVCSASHRTRCHTLQDNNDTPHRAWAITYFLPPTLQIWLPSIFGQRVAKNYPTLVDVYQLTGVLQQVWQSKLFRPSSSPRVSAVSNVFQTCCGLPWSWVTSATLKKKDGVILEGTSLLLLLEIKWVL